MYASLGLNELGKLCTTMLWGSMGMLSEPRVTVGAACGCWWPHKNYAPGHLYLLIFLFYFYIWLIIFHMLFKHFPTVWIIFWYAVSLCSRGCIGQDMLDTDCVGGYYPTPMVFLLCAADHVVTKGNRHLIGLCVTATASLTIVVTTGSASMCLWLCEAICMLRNVIQLTP